MRLDHLLSKEHWHQGSQEAGVYSLFLGHPFSGSGASDCGTLTIRPGTRLIELVLLILFGGEAWNVSEGRGKGRGALLGPEESGRLSFGGGGSVFLGHYYTGIFADLGVAVWLGPVFTKPLVGS